MKCRLIFIGFLYLISFHLQAASVVIGEFKVWYPVSVTIDGPSVDESESTFRNYRLDVTFTKGTKSYKVPGFFAADGNAAETSATSGNKWRAIFTPDEAGTWHYFVSLRTGADVAISILSTAGVATTGDGLSGSFTISTASFNEPGLFAKGKLIYAGEHYGQFAGNKEWHVKAGPGSPEDFLGYKDFDNTSDWETRNSSTQVQDVYLRNLNGEGLHYYSAHINDWKVGDATWKNGKGKGIIGSLNYMASIGVNSLYMIPFTINDDSDNTWPWTSRDSQMSYDVSKLAQWDIVFSHMDRVGISATYYLCECDNSRLLDNADMILKNPIYYREIIARFGYHLGIRFNLGEELRHTCAQQKEHTKYFKAIDPYKTIICGHSSHVRSTQLSMFECLLGEPTYDGPNYQLHQNDNKDHLDLVMWREKSAIAGKKWIVANDETWGIDNSTGSNGEGRMLLYAWRTIMAGAEGMFQYTAYGKPEIGDITLENFRLIENTQKIHIISKDLFLKKEINPHLPQMKNMNALVGNPTGNDAPFCLAKSGELYVVYRTSSTNQKLLDLSGVDGQFLVKWYDARNGGDLVSGSVAIVSGGGSVNLGNPPTNASGSWAIVVMKDEVCNEEKTISLSMEGYAGSSVLGGGKYCVNKTTTITAVVSSDAEFVNWTENGMLVSTNNPYSFTVTENRNLVANFIKSNVTNYTINVSQNTIAGGTTVGATEYKQNEIVTLVASPEPCYVFTNWTENGNSVSTNSTYSFVATSNRDLMANFTARTFTALAEPTIGGVVSGDINYACGAVINVSAVPNPGYTFVGWYADSKLITNQLVDAINIGEAFQLIAKFIPTHTIRYLDGSTTTYYAPEKISSTLESAKSVSIGKTLTPPVIDGADNESCWNMAPLYVGQTIGIGDGSEYVYANADAQLSWKAVWDESALYTIIKIKDDVLVWNDANNIWNIDAIEYYVTKDAIVNAETGLNLNRSNQAKVLWQNLYLASPQSRSIMEFRGADNTSLAGTKQPVVGTSAARTYNEASKTSTFEIKYEWNKILTGINAFTTVTENDKIRLSFMFSDNDNAATNKRDHKVFYAEKLEPSVNLSFRDWAIVTLKNNVTSLQNTIFSNKVRVISNQGEGLLRFSEPVNLAVYTVMGQVILNAKNSTTVDIMHVQSGMYILIINNVQIERYIKK